MRGAFIQLVPGWANIQALKVGLRQDGQKRTVRVRCDAELVVLVAGRRIMRQPQRALRIDEGAVEPVRRQISAVAKIGSRLIAKASSRA